jgi:hypothetical protein
VEENVMPHHVAPSPARVRFLLPVVLTALLASTIGAAGAAGSPPAEASPSAGERWREGVDRTWGPGLPTAEKLRIFDHFWQTIEWQFAAFQGIEDVDWRGLHDRYRSEVEQGVSRGRFAAIMSHSAFALRESHTRVRDVGVNITSRARRGVPLLVLDPWGTNSSGVCATALPDGTALVYEAPPGNPLGLAAGDRVLGYDGRPWTELVAELLAAELPIAAPYWGSSPSSLRHTLVASAPQNWHLFETMDVLSPGASHPRRVSTRALDQQPAISPVCSERVSAAGLPTPDTATNDVVAWDVLPGTRIGYITVWGWIGDAEQQFAEAVEELTQRRDTDGLVIDFRYNVGGNMHLSDRGLAMLFDRPTPTINFASRVAADDPYLLHPTVPQLPSAYSVDGPGAYDPRSYDRPIAVLTGPGGLSSGDLVADRLTYHPRARMFGAPTAGAFNAPAPIELGEGWFAQYAVANAYRVSGDPAAAPDYLTHEESRVDERVWLTPRDAASGRDTVLARALSWVSQAAGSSGSAP